MKFSYILSTFFIFLFLFGCKKDQVEDPDEYAWLQIGNDIFGEEANDNLGKSVCLSSDGTVLAIGAPANNGNGFDSGHVRIYKNQNGTWIQIGNDIDGEAADDNSGISVSLNADGSIIAIGAYLNDGNGMYSGHVRVYKNQNGTWIQIGEDIDGESSEDRSGNCVSMSGDGSTIAIGAPHNDGNGENSGHVRVYKNIIETWTQIGNDIDGEYAHDFSGKSVSLSNDGTILGIGAENNDGNGEGSGQVRIFKFLDGTWAQIGNDIDGESAYDYSGRSISLCSDGSTVAICASNNQDNGENSGQVRIFENKFGSWSQIGNDIDGEPYDDFGYSVSLNSNGSIVAIGAVNGSIIGHSAGIVRIYENKNGTWTQIGNDINGTAAENWSGYSVSISSDGKIVAIGAPFNSGNGTGSGQVRIYKYCKLE